MAAIDKIYGTKKQWQQLRDWLEKHKPDALCYMYKKPPNSCGEYPLSNFPSEIDYWLISNCPLDFVQERLQEQYKTVED